MPHVTTSSQPASLLTTWAQLLRLPNLFTVPGDALAGVLLAGRTWSAAALLAAAAAVLLIYMGGLLLNDVFDLQEDLEERPARPIPSGAASTRSVTVAGVCALASGVATAWLAGGQRTFFVSAALVMVVLLYDAGGKRIPLVGPTLMGLCRVGSLLLGASAVVGFSRMPLPVWLGVVTALGYTTTLTTIAAQETSGLRPSRMAYGPSVVLLVSAVGAACLLGTTEVVVAVAILLAGALEGAYQARQARNNHLPTPALIGVWVRGMLTIQTAWIVSASVQHGLPTALLSLAGMGLLRFWAEIAARRFYGS